MKEILKALEKIRAYLRDKISFFISKIELKIKNFFKIGFYKTQNGYFRKDLTYIENNKTLKSKLFGVDLGDLV